MTYAASAVAYWVGQANDNSTGTHPPGYASGQRWSVTAASWQTVYNTEFGNARDTSTGSHPTGWVSGQLWSVTASQWNTMWTTEFNNARDTSVGSHPSGWVSGQLWSVTATQWNGMWSTEWTNSHDPQGYSYSYPGQAVNAVYWSQSAAYWRGQADYYWGPSRVWNSGATWEANYNAYVGYYNDMVNQRDIWTSRANQAWGPTRVWSNGTSFETMYSTLLNGLNSPDGMQQQGFSISHNAGGSQAHYGDFSFSRAGHYFVAVILPIHASNVSQNNSQSNLVLGGSAGISLNQNYNAGPSGGAHDILHGGVWHVDVAAGATITIDYMAFVTGNPTTGTCTVYAHFVPNATYHN